MIWRKDFGNMKINNERLGSTSSRGDCGANIKCVMAVAAALLLGGHAAAVAADDVAPHLTVCGYLAPAEEKDCAAEQAIWRKDWAQAYRGDHTGQRNVAYCLSTGCQGAVVQNLILGCAWRLLIMTSGSPEINDSDTRDLRMGCGQLAADELEAAKAQAMRLQRKVRGPR